MGWGCLLERPADTSSLSMPQLLEDPKVTSDGRPKNDVIDLPTASCEGIMQFLGEPVEDAESKRVTPHLLVDHILCADSHVQSCAQLFDPRAPPSISFLLQFCLPQQLSLCTPSSWEEEADLIQQAAHPGTWLRLSITIQLPMAGWLR